MVDVPTIQQLLRDHFDVYGTATIDPETGTVDVEGRVILAKPLRKFPVQFGQVSGNFSCTECGLESLQGAPHTVGLSFGCSKNRLMSLEGAPKWVGGGFFCANNQLTNLVGAPDHVGGSMQVNSNPLISLEGMPSELTGGIWLEYGRYLPLLRLLSTTGFVMSFAPDQVKEILNKYKGEGKAGAIKAAAELVKAGFKGNAKW